MKPHSQRNPDQPPAQAQASLFDDLPSAAPAAGPALLAIPTPAAAQTKAQRLFNKLIGQIQQLRDLLALWQQYELRFHQRLATELQPAQAQLTAVRLKLLRLLDHLLTDQNAKARLSKPQRRKLRAWIPQLAATVLEDGPDAEAEAIFDRYSDVSLADQQQIELAEAEVMFGHILGEEMIEGHRAESVEELMRHAAEGLARAQAKHAARAADRSQAKFSAKARAAQQRQADAAQQASQSVREAYRKLASALHPDRETAPAAPEHKTRLMQQANQAYERQDLLTLLSMQLDLEQIDGQHLAQLPEARLAHYNRVLLEQLAALQQEVGECTAHFRSGMGLTQRELTPALVDKALARDIDELRGLTRLIELDIAQLRDPATRQQALADIEIPDEDDNQPDAFEAMLLMEALAGAPAFRPPRRPFARRAGSGGGRRFVPGSVARSGLARPPVLPAVGLDTMHRSP